MALCIGCFFDTNLITLCPFIVVHEKNIRHRNIVVFSTIFLLITISSITFVRGIAWVQVVWRLYIFEDGDALLVISFFSWLCLLLAVHAMFLWHTLRTEKKKIKQEDASADLADGIREESRHSTGRNTPSRRARLPNSSSYDAFIFDPRSPFKDVKCPFSGMEEFQTVSGDEISNVGTPVSTGELVVGSSVVVGVSGDTGAGTMNDDILNPNAKQTADKNVDDDDEFNINGSSLCTSINPQTSSTNTLDKQKQRPDWCEVFVCFSPEYQQSSLIWKVMCWIKIFILTMSYLICIYFVLVSIGATTQIESTKEKLPAVQETLYNHMNEGEVCAFDNRGPESNITTFEGKEAAHEAGFLVLHCGACGACSSWDNLIVEYVTRDKMASLANECAKGALFKGGDDALTECLMSDDIGFEEECAICWSEDILCTKQNCAFIFLQAQMINNVGNFAVGPNDITSASCEEAHCEVGQFVPCSGATRRRMNITSSIARPGGQQCGIVDVKDWEDLFFGSGVA